MLIPHQIIPRPGGPVALRVVATPRGLPRRNIDIWLPPGAARSGRRYPVIYMHDGQNLFDPQHAYLGIDWGIDEALEALMRERGLPGAIVVGVWNGPERWREYAPQRPFFQIEGTPGWQVMLERAGGIPVSDAYLAFLVEKLKPWVDANLPTLPDQPNTFVMGSSMGGLVSLYALSRYPTVFGGAGCVSTHWLAGGADLVDVMAADLPPPGRHRLYFDYGTATLDAGYEPLQRQMDDHLRTAGYSEGVDWVTHKFPGAEHSERSWRERAGVPLGFLLGG